MQQAEFLNKPGGIGARFLVILLRLPSTVRILITILGLAALAAGAYFAPTLAAYGLAFLGLGLPLFLLVWFRPELGLLGVIFVTSSFIAADTIDLRLPIGGGLDLGDLVLLGMCGILVFRGLVRKALPIPWWPIGGLLLLFLGLAVVSAAYALFFQGVGANWAFSELRGFIFYAVFFLTAWTLTERRELVVLVAGLFILGDITVGILFLQQFLGIQARVLTAMSATNWQVDQQIAASGEFGSVRIIPPGHVLMFFLMIIALCLTVFTRGNRRLRIVALLQFVILSMGLVLTYTRAEWVATALVFGLVSLVIFSTYKAQFMRYLVPGLAVLLFVLALGGLFAAELQKAIDRVPFLNSLVVRALSTFEPGDEGLEPSSLEWRVFETKEALRSLSKEPLLGVGLGNTYRYVTLQRGEAAGRYGGSLTEGARFTRYIHSSYVSIATKMGLPALVIFLGFCTAFLVKSWQLFKDLPHGQPKWLVLAVMTGFIGLLAWATLHNDLVKMSSTATVGLMTGLVAGIRYIYGPGPASCTGHRGLT